MGYKGRSDPVIRTDPRGKECLSIEQSPGEGAKKGASGTKVQSLV